MTLLTKAPLSRVSAPLPSAKDMMSLHLWIIECNLPSHAVIFKLTIRHRSRVYTRHHQGSPDARSKLEALDLSHITYP